jgi:hypothetical protein
MRLDETVFYSVCCICCLSRRDSRGWDAMAYPRPACLGGVTLMKHTPADVMPAEVIPPRTWRIM